MSGNNINNNYNNSFFDRMSVHSLNRINKGIQDQNEKLSTGKSVNKAEEDSVSISKSAKLRSQMAAMEQSLSSTDSASQEDYLANSLVALASANSTIIDTDMAKAQSESIRQKILQDVTSAENAQANLEFGQLFNALA